MKLVKKCTVIYKFVGRVMKTINDEVINAGAWWRDPSCWKITLKCENVWSNSGLVLCCYFVLLPDTSQGIIGKWYATTRTSALSQSRTNSNVSTLGGTCFTLPMARCFLNSTLTPEAWSKTTAKSSIIMTELCNSIQIPPPPRCLWVFTG